MLHYFLSLFLISITFIPSLLFFYIRLKIKKRKVPLNNKKSGRNNLFTSNSSFVIGFFHPYCNAGGGGERVLWAAVRNLSHHYSSAKFVIFTGDVNSTSTEILSKARDRFGISLTSQNVKFVYLKKRWLLEASLYPILTLLGQSLGSIFVAYEAISKAPCDVFIDTMGYAFTYPVIRYLIDCPIISYTHYPTISTDMLQIVSKRTAQYNNRKLIANSLILSRLKTWYYQLFALLYGICGRCADVVMANSTWTAQHLRSLFHMPIPIVYPPCDTSTFFKFELNGRLPWLISIAQFRPEKRLDLQILAFHQCHSHLPSNSKLILIGSCRGKEDEDRVIQLRELVQSLNLTTHQVDFRVNASYSEVQHYLKQGSVGLHTMKEEHFGIGIVEYMASGLIPLAHRSGGPLLDIVIPYKNQSTGFLAETVEEYSEQMIHLFSLSNEKQLEIRENARASVHRFSEQMFDEHWILHFKKAVHEHPYFNAVSTNDMLKK